MQCGIKAGLDTSISGRSLEILRLDQVLDNIPGGPEKDEIADTVIKAIDFKSYSI